MTFNKWFVFRRLWLHVVKDVGYITVDFGYFDVIAVNWGIELCKRVDKHYKDAWG